MRCYAIGGRINFNYDTISFCHGMDIGDKIIWRWQEDKTFDVNYYLNKVDEFNKKNMIVPRECEGCSNLSKENTVPTQIEIVTINPNWYCQNRCVYCGNFQGKRKELYNPLPIINEFIDRGLIAHNCLFDWGGGEPTISDCFEDIFMYLLNSGYMQRVNTNAIKMSNMVFNNLHSHNLSLRISIDAGNRETFLYTKGRDLFEQVVHNIGEYRKQTNNIVAKYVITCTNSNEDSVRDFISLVKKLNISTICIDTEMMSFGNRNYNGLLRFTDNEIHAANLMRELGKENGLNVQTGYVWTAQNNEIPSRDYNHISSISELLLPNETYPIPKKLYFSHMEHNKIYHSGISPKVIASWEVLINEITCKQLFIYGAGKNGEQLAKALVTEGINDFVVVDKHMSGKVFKDRVIISPTDMASQCTGEFRVIVTPYCANEIIQEFNDNEWLFLKNKILVMDSYRYTDKAINSLKGNI